MDNQNPKEDQSKQIEKDTKKQFESYYEVAKHKLGRAPSMEEVLEIMNNMPTSNGSEHPMAQQVPMPNEAPPQEDGAEEILPAILGMKVYHGMKEGEDGQRGPDENKILFYENPEGSVFDCSAQEWLESKPEVVNHLMSRPINYSDTDIVSAIVNGVMGDEDFEALDKAGLITENPRKLWELTSKLKSQVDELERSTSGEYSEDLEKSDDESEVEGEEFDYEESNTDSDEFEEESDTQDFSSDNADLPGDNQLAEIIKSAMSEALTGPYLEQAIRRIVREELSGGNSQENEEI